MRQCQLCGKGSQMQGKRRLLRGHYNPVNWSRKYPNIQSALVDGKRMRVCTQCIRTIAKSPVVRKPRRSAEKAAAANKATASKTA